jgi:hypothetical protein
MNQTLNGPRERQHTFRIPVSVKTIFIFYINSRFEHNALNALNSEINTVVNTDTVLPCTTTERNKKGSKGR